MKLINDILCFRFARRPEGGADRRSAIRYGPAKHDTSAHCYEPVRRISPGFGGLHRGELILYTIEQFARLTGYSEEFVRLRISGQAALHL